ncbi:putative acetyltransferase [Pseudonocardia ammonioxydans]|uniref:Putative acetyltransferase n=1 Tax=Pseudonocardia ammonioxydans TaxID=260086 RepID=A0A1I4U3E9_PSUAM|nr:GNAT family N-acetyltransferase [Pseudonocardia ammonioxydans]SFM83360.1 putative acetyltransferase [Pseudonocardia ammonioxydans]
MRIAIDDLSGTGIAELLAGHLAEVRAQSPPESSHALDLDALRRPGVSVWAVHDAGTLVGCGALKELDPDGAEIKSMRTAPQAQRRGVASALLGHLIGVARDRGYRSLYLETGTTAFFAPARRLYARHGFVRCPPFADYPDDPNSVHMRLDLPTGCDRTIM